MCALDDVALAGIGLRRRTPICEVAAIAGREIAMVDRSRRPSAHDMWRIATEPGDQRAGPAGVGRTEWLLMDGPVVAAPLLEEVRRPFMTFHRLSRVLTVVLVVGGAAAVASPSLQAQEMLVGRRRRE